MLGAPRIFIFPRPTQNSLGEMLRCCARTALGELGRESRLPVRAGSHPSPPLRTGARALPLRRLAARPLVGEQQGGEMPERVGREAWCNLEAG